MSISFHSFDSWVKYVTYVKDCKKKTQRMLFEWPLAYDAPNIKSELIACSFPHEGLPHILAVRINCQNLQKKFEKYANFWHNFKLTRLWIWISAIVRLSNRVKSISLNSKNR